MSFPAFALEWANGRIFLIDLGMQRQDALAFGRPNQWLAGAEPIEAHRDVAAALGADRARVSGVGFTHLHSDHTAGAVALCRDAMRPIHVFYTPLQAIESNYTTRFGRGPIERAGCLEPRLLSLGPLHPVPGFPGLSVFATGGHTPGSQVFVAHLGGEERGRSLVFAGDLVNHWDGIRHNVPKPGWYSLWIVPEHTRRLDRLRRYLAELSERPGVTVLVSHDRGHLEAEGIPFAR
jgi:glyoxylase-like metal-dependent hydrolase (beta-lactamase superfamily II)